MEAVWGLLGFPRMVFFRKDNLSEKDCKSQAVDLNLGEMCSLGYERRAFFCVAFGWNVHCFPFQFLRMVYSSICVFIMSRCYIFAKREQLFSLFHSWDYFSPPHSAAGDVLGQALSHLAGLLSWNFRDCVYKHSWRLFLKHPAPPVLPPSYPSSHSVGTQAGFWRLGYASSSAIR